ncbi:hypothetical protein [Algoriphagus jejuensis]|uniref:hypothetical protein n=1 Tax=Algoriphagus jejuensis TaxID=419934 RepID=UPI0031CE0F6A
MTKKITLVYIIVIFSTAFFQSCNSKEGDDQNPQNLNDKYFEGKDIRGRILLPEGMSSEDLEVMNVMSNTDASPYSEGEFGLDLDGTYTAFFARYSNSEVALMGYFYPGAADFNITPRSTALAMVMMTPAVVSLSDEGKKSFIA